MIMKGQKINDRYQIIKSIGEGGMANVYLAYDTILDRNVAIKVLRGDLSTDEKFVRRFQREALSASSLNHPNIVEVYDVGEDGGQYYIVMEYIEGKHLKALLKKRGTLTVSEVIDIMLQITEGLTCAHDAYIIHRDIKPQNIMILENGLIKITDFGIAMATNATQLTQTNTAMGSVHYFPPEQASGKGSTLKSDIYSMGIVMYELLTGHLPYKGDSAVEIALKHLKEAIPSIREFLPDIPQSVENIILKATAKNPKNRYADAREMHEDLKTCLGDERINEPIYNYPYPEIEFDDTKIMKAVENPKLDDKTTDKDGDTLAKKITDQDLKKQNKLLIILASIFTGLILVITTIMVFLPMLASQQEIKVPDVGGLDVTAAINRLQEAGFKVNDEQEEKADDEVPEGKVIKTNPAADSKRTKGTTITLFVSTGPATFTMENYVGRNYLEVKAILEANGIYVIAEKEEVDKDKKYKDGEIIRQSVSEGIKLSPRDTVTLYYPDIITKFPNFTDGTYSLSDIEAFCEEYSITLEVEYVETSEYQNGAIFYQSKPEGYTVTAGTTIKIKIAESVEGGEEDPDCIPGLC